jgi:hypothetical protein
VYQNIAATHKKKKTSRIGSHIQANMENKKKASQIRLARDTGKYEKQKKPAKIG